MSWENLPVSFYKNHYDNIGEPATLRDALYWKFYPALNAIIEMRKLDPADQKYDEKKKELKKVIPLFAPSALLKTRGVTDEEKKQGITIKDKVVSLTHLVQFDFDNCYEYDLQELKAAIFSLPFVAWVSLSCSGQGVFALALISETDRQEEYVKHCQGIFKDYGLPVDKSKGENVNDLRYVSYDSSPLWRDNPEPLHIKRFKAQQQQTIKRAQSNQQFTGNRSAVVKRAIDDISTAQVGQRWETVRKWAYTAGGYQDKDFLGAIEQAIKNSSQFSGYEDHCLGCAADAFAAGINKPFPV